MGQPFIHTLESIILFSEVEKHCRNDCPPKTERILFTFCVALDGMDGPEAPNSGEDGVGNSGREILAY